jgi:hypothetical protein
MRRESEIRKALEKELKDQSKFLPETNRCRTTAIHTFQWVLNE